MGQNLLLEARVERRNKSKGNSGACYDNFVTYFGALVLARIFRWFWDLRLGRLLHVALIRED